MSTIIVQRGNGNPLVTSGSSLIASIQYNGTVQNHGMFDGGVTGPAHTDRLNYDGNFHANALYDTGMGGLVKTYDDARWIDIKRQGFVDNTQTTLSFDDLTYTFTLGSVGATWDYIYQGILYTITGNKTVVLPGSPPTTGKYFISIDNIIGTLDASLTNWSLTDSRIQVAVLYWNNSLTPKYWISEERHTCLKDNIIMNIILLEQDF